MTTAYDYHSDIDRAAFWDSLKPSNDGARQPNLLLPSTRFTLFALTAIVAGAALAFVT